MAETDDTQPDDGNNGGNDDLGGVLGEVGLDYEDEDDEADDTTDEDAVESTETTTEDDTSGSEPAQTSDDDPAADSDEQSGAVSEPEADDGPFAPDPGMQLTESFGTKLTPPEKEFVELYVEFSDEYDNPGAFLREFVRQLRQEYGEEVMRRKKALEELKGGL